ncbi:hypothetical protein TNCV_4299781 [Trichonephila clavipes]|nr:hypothetical protein TNCV_4299781 [Trichonephila clavipes]
MFLTSANTERYNNVSEELLEELKKEAAKEPFKKTSKKDEDSDEDDPKILSCTIHKQCRFLRYNDDSMRTWRNLGGRAKLASFLATMLASSEPSGIF